jgi:colanic acid/amylovoran biosynthesis glycosyltransferase
MGVKVAYVLEPPYPTFFVAEVEAVRRTGADVVVFNSFRPFTQTYEAAERLRAESFYFAAGYSGVLGDNAGAALRRPAAYAWAAAFALRHGLGPRLVALTAHYARLVKEQGITHLHAGYGTTPATVALLTSRLSGVPYSFTLHAYDIFLPNPLLPQKAQHARFFTTISQFNREFIKTAHPTVDRSRLEVVRLGVDLRVWTPRAAEPSHAVPVCVSVANLVPFKGHDVLLRAAARLKDAGTRLHCVLIGDGALRGSLEALAHSLGISDRVTFAGRLDSAQVREHLLRADVCALPAVVDAEGNRDGIPVALMEAMASGVPVVSSRVAGIPELVVDGVTGLLTPSGDDAALAAALRSLVTSATLRQSLTQAARAHVEAEFDISRTARRMVQLFGGGAA